MQMDCPDPRMCEGCFGTGARDLGDCENGVLVECGACDGEGEIDE
jgi:hypothetical protein